MRALEKIGRFSICEDRKKLYLRWWNPHLKKSQAERLSATTLEDARREAKARIRVVAEPSETVHDDANGDPTFGEVWLAFEQEKRKRLGAQRFRLLENRKELYFKPHLWSVRMSRMGPALREVVRGMEEGRILPESTKSKLQRKTADGRPRLHPNTISDIVGSAVEVCALAKSDGVSSHNPPRKPFISGTTAPEDRDPKGRYLTFEEIGALIDAARRPHLRDLLLLTIGCGGRVGAVADMKGEFVYPDLGVIDLLGYGSLDSNKRRPIVPISGPMSGILERIIREHGDEYLIRAGRDPLAAGARNWTQMIQRLVKRAGIDYDLKPNQPHANWYSIRRTLADFLDSRVSDAAISSVLGHFEVSNRNRRQLFESGSPMTDVYKRRKLGSVLEVAAVLDEEWW
ncbi:MAG TPA: hypothetical protein DEO85_03130 [Maritimibacter sp.]|nr:hypothetical protein [Maritimibacter sp.]